MKVTVSITLDVDTAAYDLNYGRTDDAAEYAAEIANDAVTERFRLLGWATVTTTAHTIARA